jgi:voltage-gated potassium channel
MDDPVERDWRKHPLVGLLGSTTVILGLLTLGYYMLPIGRRADEDLDPARLVGAAVAFGALAAALLWQVRRTRERQPPVFAITARLLSALYLLILVFAIVYGLLGFYTDDQFSGIVDKTDALYFAVTVTSTVGFGDITATGTLGQAVVTVHMLFNLIYVGTALRLLSYARPRYSPSSDGDIG